MAVETLPLSPIEADLEANLEKTVGYYDSVREFVDECVRNGLKNVYLVGAGGSLIASFPAFYLLHRMVDIPVFQIQSDELNYGRPRPLGPGSLVIIASYTGTTKETVAAARYAREARATVFAACRAPTPPAPPALLRSRSRSTVTANATHSSPPGCMHSTWTGALPVAPGDLRGAPRQVSRPRAWRAVVAAQR